MISCQLYLIDGSVEAASGPNDFNISWPPRSPDLSPMDFFVWGFVKKYVYNRNYENVENLEKYVFPGI